MAAVKISFAKHALEWAEEVAARRNMVVAQCAVHDESVAEDLPVANLSAGAGSDAYAGKTTTGSHAYASSSVATGLDVLMGFHFDAERFKASEFHRARRELPVVPAIMTDICSIPLEEANQAVEEQEEEEEEVEEDEEEEDVEGEMPTGDPDSDPDVDYNPALDK